MTLRDQGRDAYRQWAWADAYTSLSSADDESPLEPPDLDLLVTAAYLVGRDETGDDLSARAYREWLNRNEPARGYLLVPVTLELMEAGDPRRGAREAGPAVGTICERRGRDGRRPRVQAAMGGLIGQFAANPIPPVLLDRIDVPTALIWGREDLATPLAIAQAVGARMGWPLYVIDDAGDDPPLDQPAAFLDALRATLATPAAAITRGV